MKNYELAKTAYDAYCRATGGKSLISGQDLPPFENLSDPIKDAWYEAAQAVAIQTARRSGGLGRSGGYDL